MSVTTTPTQPEPYCDTQAVARFLGTPTSWVYDNAERLGIPRHKLGPARWRYRLSEVAAWLESQRDSASV